MPIETTTVDPRSRRPTRAENGFTYGILFANEPQAAGAAQRRARALNL
ncbi:MULTISPECIES: hypothetical protein [Nocardiaceae]|nr:MULTISPECIES: hypothetical protein [Rhodococcus]WQH28688.1 hypothetical protein U2G91_01500 [Rhodococcus fascians]